jgi:prophage regulatory protein
MSSEHAHLELPRKNHNPMTPVSDKDAATFVASSPMQEGGRTSKVPTRILRLPEVMCRVGMKRASIYHAISQSSFPKQIILSKRSVGWLEQEIEDWLAARISASRSKQD